MPTTKTKDAINLLKTDHEKVRALFAELQETPGRATKKRMTLMNELIQEITIHAQLEEEIFYPAYQEIATDEEEAKKFYEAAEEHGIVKMLLPELDTVDAGTAEFAAKIKVLNDLVEHHAKEEEREMFKIMRRELGREELIELGARIMERKQEIMGAMGMTKKRRTKAA
jgi:hypothetical protein